MSQPPRPSGRRSGLESERQWRNDLAEHEQEHEQEHGHDDEAHAHEAEDGLNHAVPVPAPAPVPVYASAPGGPVMDGRASPGAADPDDDDDLLCVICLQSCAAQDEIWSCEQCALVSHLECIRSWLQESEAKGRFGKCPACSDPVGYSSFELTYRCWCRRVCWSGDMAGGEEGQAPSHSCGAVCGRERLNSQGCPHPCEMVCHRGRCRPCGHIRAGVRCVGGHKTYDAFPCGSEPAALCALPCGAQLPCGHPCTAPCHGADKPHAACMQLVPRDCACGKKRADGPAASALLAPCSQQVVQCDAPCGRLQCCGQHVCERRCHTGNCQELMVVSAWNKGGWIKVGGAAAPAAAAPVPVRPAAAQVEDAAFPALGASPVPSAASRAPAQALPAAQAGSSSGTRFTTCGKVCNKRRACGHLCTQSCHAIAGSSASAVAAPASASSARPESKESEEANGSVAVSASPPPAAASAPECDAVACTQLVHVVCPCGRKSDTKVRCNERSKRAALALCDHVCAVHAQGRLFETELARAVKEDPETFGELRALLPWPAHLLALLCGGSSVAALSSGGGGGISGGSAHAVATEAQFLRKTEIQIRKFVVDMAATLDREEAAAAAAAASTAPPTPSAGGSAPVSKHMAAAAACVAVAPVRHLFLSGLTPARRLLVAQLALACNVHFDGDTGLEALPSAECRVPLADLEGGAGAAARARRMSGAAPSPHARSNDDDGEERKGKEEADGAPSLHPPPEAPVSCDVTFLLPSPSLAASADVYKQSSHLPSLCTADSWPASLRIRVHFDGDEQRAVERAEPGRQLQRWLAPWTARCRSCWVGARTVAVLFTSPLLAHQCYVHLTRAHAGELAGSRVLLEAPGTSAAPAVRAAIAAEAAEAAALRRVESDTRRAQEEEFAALQDRLSKQRAANPAPSSSVLPAAPTGRHSHSVVRNIVGRAKIKIKASNMFQLLGEEDDA